MSPVASFGFSVPGSRAATTAGDLDHILAAQPVRSLRNLRLLLRPENHLGQPLAVAQVDEDDAPVVAAGIDPAGERDGLADMFLAKLVAEVRAVHGWEVGVGTADERRFPQIFPDSFNLC